MDNQCWLTVEQLQALVEGQTIRISYQTLEDYGYIDEHKVELIPPDAFGGGVQLMGDGGKIDEDNCARS